MSESVARHLVDNCKMMVKEIAVRHDGSTLIKLGGLCRGDESFFMFSRPNDIPVDLSPGDHVEIEVYKLEFN